MTRAFPIFILCLLISCSEVSDMTGGGFDEKKADAKYLQYGKQFGNLLMEKENN